MKPAPPVTRICTVLLAVLGFLWFPCHGSEPGSWERQRRASLTAGGSGAGVETLGVDTERMGDLLDDDLLHQLTQLALVTAAGLDRPPVDDHPGRQAARRREEAAQGHVVGLPRGGVGGGHVLDGELQRL